MVTVSGFVVPITEDFMIGSGERTPELEFLGRIASASSRRMFLKWSGITIGVAVVGASCDDDDDDDSMMGPPPGDGNFNLGTGDTAVLNLAFALEQLEADFYTRMAQAFFGGATAEELEILTDIRDHEVAHRQFLAGALAANAIDTLTFTYPGVDFGDRASVLQTARTFEDLGVAAYNSAASLLVSADLLLQAGRIVSVEARHAAAIRGLLAPGSDAFAGDDVVDAQGLEHAVTIPQVLATAEPFINETLETSGLPAA